MPTMDDDDDVKSAGGACEPEVFLQHYRAGVEQSDIISQQKEILKSIIARAAGSGVHTKAMKMADKIVGMGEREGKTFWDAVTLYVNLISGGMLTQEELFPAQPPENELFREIQKRWTANRIAKEEGYAAGKNAEPNNNNPYEAGSEEFDLWARSWIDGKARYDEENERKEIAPKLEVKNPRKRAAGRGGDAEDAA